jgi:hypothetical protein
LHAFGARCTGLLIDTVFPLFHVKRSTPPSGATLESRMGGGSTTID